MSRLHEWIASGPLVADGAWGTELQKRGLSAGALADLWNLDHPDLVEEVAGWYAQAGSRVVLTNTFRSNPITLAAHGIAERTEDINGAGVRISRRAAPRALVFASIGPTGKILLTGEISPLEVKAAFTRQATALADAGADALLVETMSDLEEARLAVAAARTTGLPVIVSFAFDSGRKHDRTMMGATPEQAARAAEECGADAVGANCGAGADTFPEICRRMRAVCTLPLWMKPNAGLPSIVDDRVAYCASAESFVEGARSILEADAAFIGGCCGTTPDFIRALAELAV